MKADQTGFEGGEVEPDTVSPASASGTLARRLSCDGIWAQWTAAGRSEATAARRYRFSVGTGHRRGRRGKLGAVLPALAVATFLAVGPPLSSPADAQGLPSVSIEAKQTRHGYGFDDVTFELTRSGDTSGALTVEVSMTQDDTYLSSSQLEFEIDIPAGAAASGTATLVGDTVPSAPLNLSLAAGHGEVTVRWDAPADDGGQPVTKHQYRVRANGETNWDPDWSDIPEIAPGEANPNAYTVAGLTNGVEYTIGVRAFNANGAGADVSGTVTPLLELMAMHDTAATPVDTALAIPVLENDIYTSASDSRLMVTKVTGSVHGTPRIDESGTGVVYVPDAGFAGIDRFTYTVSDGSIIDTAAVIVTVGGGSGVPVWQAVWSSTAFEQCTTLSLGVTNTNPDVPVADDEWTVVTLHVDRQRSTVAETSMEVKDASATTLDAHSFSPNIDHEGAWVYIVGTTAGATSTVMTVKTTGTEDPPCDGTLVAWVYVNGWLAGRDRLTITPATQRQAYPSDSPLLRISDARGREGSDGEIAFDVTLEGMATGKVAVDYATSDGSAFSGEDYTGVTGTLTFAAGERRTTLTVPLLDDAKNEGEETFAVTLSSPTGARMARARATGTIGNDDVMPKAWLARFGRTVAGQVVDAVSERLAAPPRSQVTVGGVELGARGTGDASRARDLHTPPDWETERHGPERNRAFSPTLRELLARSGFHLRSDGTGVGPAYSAWGRVALGGFGAEVDDTRLDGRVATGIVGADVEWKDMLAGVALSYSEGDGTFALSSGMPSNRGRGRIESALASVYPYVRVLLGERTSAWALAGAGRGDLTLTEDGGNPIHTGIDLRMGAVGARGTLVPAPDAGGIEFSVKSDAFWARTSSDAVRSATTGNLAASEADSTRVRLALEGERVFALAGGGTVVPTIEVGVRHDGGDAETGAGLEAGAGMRYSVDRLTIEGSVRALLAHEQSGYEEWGARGAIRIDPGASGRGLSLSVSPSFGASSGGVDRLWSHGGAPGFPADAAFDRGSRLDTELGYGLCAPVGPGVLTPYTGLSVGQGGGRTMRFGARWLVAPTVSLAMEAARIEGFRASPEPSVRVRASARW